MIIQLLTAFFLAASLSPANADISEVEAAIMNKNYEQARVLAGKVLKDTVVIKQRVMAQYYLGLSQLRLGQYANARKNFQIVMQAAMSQDLYDKAGVGLVEGLYMANFYKDAVKEGEALLRKSPNSQSRSLIYLKITRAYLKLMEWQMARNYLQKIVDEFPQSFEAPIAKSLLEEKEYFAVQVGSFLDKDKAVKLSEELKAKGQYAYVVETSTENTKEYYRVRVGQMRSLGDAQSLENQLSRQGYPTLIYP